MTRQPDRPVEILLVDDHPGDVRLMEEAFAEAPRFRAKLSVVSDGEEAMAFLRKGGRFADAARPDLILLDLNLPKMNGRAVLAEIGADPTLAHIPVIVLTTSAAEQDVTYAYQFHANCYITKPVELEELFRVIRLISEFWLGVVVLPRG